MRERKRRRSCWCDVLLTTRALALTVRVVKVIGAIGSDARDECKIVRSHRGVGGIPSSRISVIIPLAGNAGHVHRQRQFRRR